MNKFIYCVRFSIFALVLVFAYSRPAAAISCDIYMTGNQMRFGTINLLDPGTKTATATLTYGCSDSTEPAAALLCISLGPSPGAAYDPRYLEGPNRQKLAFNLYTDASLSTVWGSIDSGGAPPAVPLILSIPANKRVTGTIQVYGKLTSGGQTGLPDGHYSTNAMGDWPVKLDYRTYQAGSPVDCSRSFVGQHSTRFYIEAIISKDCRIDGTSALDFGTANSGLDQNIDSVSAITVTCNGTAYRVGLDNGQNAQGKIRRMYGPKGYVQYELYRDTNRTQRWGNDLWNDGVARTGTGLPQALTVYGRVPRQVLPGNGEYSDIITVTVDY